MSCKQINEPESSNEMDKRGMSHFSQSAGLVLSPRTRVTTTFGQESILSNRLTQEKGVHLSHWETKQRAYTKMRRFVFLAYGNKVRFFLC